MSCVCIVARACTYACPCVCTCVYCIIKMSVRAIFPLTLSPKFILYAHRRDYVSLIHCRSTFYSSCPAIVTIFNLNLSYLRVKYAHTHIRAINFFSICQLSMSARSRACMCIVSWKVFTFAFIFHLSIIKSMHTNEYCYLQM